MSKEEQILEVAMKVFRERGYHAASMQEIADAVGMQKGSLYYYISGKQELLFMILDRAIDTITARVEEIYRSDLSPKEKLWQAIVNHVEVVSERQDMLTILLRERHALSPNQQAVIDEKRVAYERLFQRILTEGVRAGEFREMDVKIVSFGILGMCNWLYQWYSSEGRLSAKEIGDIFADIVFRGVVVQDGQEPRGRQER
ncbi:MAG TPA: TetR/AcrR family transcriptional regulator [Clostridiales bacterium]|nr:TetR/AcrR family transcriptional regulator [Clostridiales bacterium]